MKKRALVTAIASLVVVSLLTQIKQASDEELFEEEAAGARSIASEPNLNLKIKAITETVELCDRSFDLVHYQSSDSRFFVAKRNVKLQGAEYEYLLPSGLENRGNINAATLKVEGPSLIQLKNPPLPVVPILPLDAPEEIQKSFCVSVRDFHKKYSAKFPALNSRRQTPSANIPLGVDWDASARKILQRPNSSIRLGFNNKLFLIFYVDQYRREVSRIADIYRRKHYAVRTIKVSEIPGVHPARQIPDSCAGAYMTECYHSIDQSLENVTGEAVGALKGFYTKSKQGSKLIPYLPGLIRAEIRKQKSIQPLSGVLLVGNSEDIAPFFYPMLKYGENSSDLLNSPPSYLNTDLFYILPDQHLELLPQAHHVKPTTFIWSCQDPNTGLINQKTYCDESDVRYWSPTTPISNHRWEPRFPASRVFRFENIPNYNISGNAAFANYKEEDVIPVGRIVTHHDRFKNDPVVAQYADKIIRWHQELPSFIGTSLATYGGRDSDTWTFLDTDVTQFRATYGEASPQYASQYFIPLAQCQGLCSFKDAQNVLAELASKNHVSFYMTGHGGDGVEQAPYPAGYNTDTDTTLNFSSDHYYYLKTENIQVKLGFKVFPAYSTVIPLKNAGLIGHVVANSCDLSDINLDKGWDESIRQLKKDSNQRSFAEQLIAIENGGAMNTFLNSDVGWGYTDDHYSQKFMINVGIANARCGTIGDALRLTVLDMLKGNTYNTGDWQLLNRQFLGSPINRIAKLPSACRRVIFEQRASK